MSPENKYDQYKDRLSEAGLKVTHQRLVIYDALMCSEGHPTAENIYDSIKENHPTVSLGTVYKTLDTFVNKGLAEKILSHENQSRYDANTEHHNHIYCTNTEEIVDFQDEELIELIQTYLNKKQIKNLSIKDIHLQIFGEKKDPDKNISIS